MDLKTHVARRRFAVAGIGITLGTILVLMTGLLAACGSGGSGGSRDAAPPFSGATTDGAAVSLSEYRGKPLVLAFMASW
ncbi:MAG: hypothetical protein A2133_06430 [Actinobacteria bacterium RBG_16_64_13]|nr:MAG: hypothetical protein A2133_06430 [Actinobacteria bacterium RBG_16_64_13]